MANSNPDTTTPMTLTLLFSAFLSGIFDSSCFLFAAAGTIAAAACTSYSANWLYITFFAASYLYVSTHVHYNEVIFKTHGKCFAGFAVWPLLFDKKQAFFHLFFPSFSGIFPFFDISFVVTMKIDMPNERHLWWRTRKDGLIDSVRLFSHLFFYS